MAILKGFTVQSIFSYALKKLTAQVRNYPLSLSPVALYDAHQYQEEEEEEYDPSGLVLSKRGDDVEEDVEDVDEQKGDGCCEQDEDTYYEEGYYDE